MPLYEFKDDRNNSIERIYTVNDVPDFIIEEGSRYTRIKYHGSKVKFKGSGFYCNDYRSS